MKQVITSISFALLIVSCQNTGDKNQSDIKVRETDSAIRATDPTDAAGSSGRNDTAITPNKTTGPSSSAPATSNSDSTKSGTIPKVQPHDSSSSGMKSKSKDSAGKK